MCGIVDKKDGGEYLQLKVIFRWKHYHISSVLARTSQGGGYKSDPQRVEEGVSTFYGSDC